MPQYPCVSEARIIAVSTLSYQAVLELDNVAMSDTLEDGNLRLEVLKQFGGELATDDRLDGDQSVSVLVRRAFIVSLECPGNNLCPAVGNKSRQQSWVTLGSIRLT